MYGRGRNSDWFKLYLDLRRKEDEIRLQLRTNGGHRGKVSQEMLIWLNDLERIENQVDRLSTQESRAEEELVSEVKSLLEKAPFLPVSSGNTAIDRVAEQLVSPTLVGKSAQSVLNQVCDYLTDPMIGTIGLYGEGGVGKTTIMKNLNNLLMESDMFDNIIWVMLSQSATIQSLQGQIAVQLGVTLPLFFIGVKERFQTNTIRTRASLISDNLKNLGRCLFLLDDIWDDILRDVSPVGRFWLDNHIWDGIFRHVSDVSPVGRVWDDNFDGFLGSIGIPEKRTGSSCNCKVVLTTRSSQVCQQIGAHKQICVSPLSENEAWNLFVSRSGNHVLDSEIRNIAEQIVYECKGLPITVITIAHAMREEVSTIAWRHALKDIRGTNDVDVDKHISDLLRFAYSHLKNEQVQKCFLY